MNCDKIKGPDLVDEVLQRCRDNYSWKLIKRNWLRHKMAMDRS